MSTLDIMQRVKQHDMRIWTPEGQVPLEIVRAKRAIEEYDENLTLGKHALTGDWCIWLKQGADKPPYPVIGLGPELPDETVIRERLFKADTRIHGDAILTSMRKKNEALEAEQRKKSEDATGVAAEAYEWAARDIKGYSGRTANVKGRKRDFKKKGD